MKQHSSVQDVVLLAHGMVLRSRQQKAKPDPITLLVDMLFIKEPLVAEIQQAHSLTRSM